MAKNENLSLDSITMPYSLETEQAVIGSILINPECVTVVLSQVKPDYFYIPQHREIMEAVMILDTLGSRIDALTILDKLNSSGNSDAEANKNYLFQIAQSVPSAANVENYCKIVREKYFLRSLITISRETIDSATEGGADADKLLDSAEQKIYDIRKGKSTGSLQRLIDVISAEVYPNLVQISSENAEEFKGIPTGFSKLDEITSGLNRSDLILIGARPAMGKTSFALNVARNIAMKGRKVLFFSLEMSKEQLAQRIISTEARIISNKLRTGDVSQADWERLGLALQNLVNCELYFDDSANINVHEMKARALRMKDIDCIVIDYLQLMSGTKRTDNRVNEVAEITRGLKMMAKDLNVPVVTCSQLSRGVAKNNGDHRPQMTDLRESGTIEQDADIVLMLHREDYYKHDTDEGDDTVSETANIAEVIVGKNRHGSTETVKVAWNPEFTMFSTLERIKDDK